MAGRVYIHIHIHITHTSHSEAPVITLTARRHGGNWNAARCAAADATFPCDGVLPDTHPLAPEQVLLSASLSLYDRTYGLQQLAVAVCTLKTQGPCMCMHAHGISGITGEAWQCPAPAASRRWPVWCGSPPANSSAKPANVHAAILRAGSPGSLHAPPLPTCRRRVQMAPCPQATRQGLSVLVDSGRPE